MPQVKWQIALDVSNQRGWHAKEVPVTEGTAGHRAHRSVSATGGGDVAHRCQQVQRPVCKRSLGASNWGSQAVGLVHLAANNWRGCNVCCKV